MSGNLVLLYAKFPQIGKSKTRIAKDSSELFALFVSFYLLKDTISKLSNSSFYDFMVVVNDNKDAKLFEDTFDVETFVLDRDFLSKNQSGRFSSLFYLFKQTYDKVVLVPSDVPSITSYNILNAFNNLDENKYVFGPEHNGGVYLIGMDNFPLNLFDSVRWSTPDSLKDLVRNCLGNTKLLELKGDINNLVDLRLFEKEIRNSSVSLYEFLVLTKFYEKFTERSISASHEIG